MRIKLLAGAWLALAVMTATTAKAAGSDDDDLRTLRIETTTADGWISVKNDQYHDIQTWGKREDGKPIRSFKVRSEMEGSVDKVVRLLLDYDSWKRWSWKVRTSKLLKKVSDTEYYAYITHESPIAVPDRDVILHMRFEPYTRQHPYVTVRYEAVPDYIPAEKGYVRIQAENMVMRIQPLPGGRVMVENEGYVDPGGGVPAWAINFVQRNVPYAIMLGMKRVIEGNFLSLDKRVPFATE